MAMESALLIIVRKLNNWWLGLTRMEMVSYGIFLCLLGSLLPIVMTATLEKFASDHVASVTRFILDALTLSLASYLLTIAVQRRQQLLEKNEELDVKASELVKVNAHLAKLVEEFKEISVKDYLTGLFNRNYLLVQCEQIECQAQRLQIPLGVAMIDLDDLKEVNDALRHDAGDELLKTIATIMRTTVRRGDVIIRIGGDEFVIIYSSSDQAECEKKLKDALDEFEFIYSKKDGGKIYNLRTSASIGFHSISDFSKMEPFLMEAIERADIDMYIKKKIKKERKEKKG